MWVENLKNVLKDRRTGLSLCHAVLVVASWSLLSWPVHAANPSTVYVYPYGSTYGESFMASLSGVVARTTPEVFMGIQGSSPSGDPEFWLDQFIADHPATQKIYQSSLPFYIDRYKGLL